MFKYIVVYSILLLIVITGCSKKQVETLNWPLVEIYHENELIKDYANHFGKEIEVVGTVDLFFLRENLTFDMKYDLVWFDVHKIRYTRDDLINGTLYLGTIRFWFENPIEDKFYENDLLVIRGTVDKSETIVFNGFPQITLLDCKLVDF